MKKVIVILILAFLFIKGVNAQTLQAQIKIIDKQRQEIKSNIGNFNKIVKLEDKTGYKYVFLKGKELQLISVRSIENDIEKNVDWFVVDNKIIYCETLWLNITTKKIVGDDKNYFNNEHMIAWINTEGKFIDHTSDDFKSVDKEVASFFPAWREKAMN
jgi:hypothetical protein